MRELSSFYFQMVENLPHDAVFSLMNIFYGLQDKLSLFETQVKSLESSVESSLSNGEELAKFQELYTSLREDFKLHEERLDGIDNGSKSLEQIVSEAVMKWADERKAEGKDLADKWISEQRGGYT